MSRPNNVIRFPLERRLQREKLPPPKRRVIVSKKRTRTIHVDGRTYVIEE